MEQRQGLATTAGTDPSRRRHHTLPTPSSSSGSDGTLVWDQPTRSFSSGNSSSSSKEHDTSLDSSGPSFERLQQAYQEFKARSANRRATPSKAKSQAGSSGTGRRRRQAAQPAALVASKLEEELQQAMQQPVQQQEEELPGSGSGSVGSAESASSSSSDEDEEGEVEFEDVFEIALVDLEDLGAESGKEDRLGFPPAGSPVAAMAEADAQQSQQPRLRLGRPPGLLRLGRPMRPEAEAFLSAKGVDTRAVVAMLPRRASELPWERIQARGGGVLVLLPLRTGMFFCLCIQAFYFAFTYRQTGCGSYTGTWGVGCYYPFTYRRMGCVELHAGIQGVGC